MTEETSGEVKKDMKGETESHITARPYDYCPVPVVVVEQGEELSHEDAEWLGRQKLVGFDCEWVPNRKRQTNPVSLIQIGTDEKVLLIRTAVGDLLPSIPDCVRNLIVSNEVVKLGVGTNDSGVLYTTFNIFSNNTVAIDQIAMKKGIRRCGLQGIAEYFGYKLQKSRSATMSNWGAKQLTAPQIEYAADDAYYSYILYPLLLNAPDRILCPIGDDGKRCEVNFDSVNCEEFWEHVEAVHLPLIPLDPVRREQSLIKLEKKLRSCIHCLRRSKVRKHRSADCEEKSPCCCSVCLKLKKAIVYHLEDEECEGIRLQNARAALSSEKKGDYMAKKTRQKTALPTNLKPVKKGKLSCFEWNDTMSCRYGDDCKFLHNSVSEW